MTREEAIAYFKDMNECTYGNVEPIQMAIKALEQEPILDKIRAEIMQVANQEKFHDAKWALGLRHSVKIIDKYAESEG